MDLALLIFLASLMVVIIVVILYYVFKVRTKLGLFFLYFGFFMMSLMLIGASVYLFNPSQTNLGIAVGLNMTSMVLLLAYFFAVAEKLTENVNLKWYHLYSLSSLVVFNEALMGLTFGLAQFGKEPFLTPVSAMYNSLNSVWFFYPMMVEMLTLYLILLKRGNNLSLFPFIGVAAFPPVIFQDLIIWRYFSLLASLGFSILGLTFKGTWRYIYLLTTVGSISTLFTPWIYDVAILVGMIAYYVTSFKTEGLSEYHKRLER
ncbi:MAG: hypothetical protein QXR86_01000 [Metallosphaera sp.]|uniref:hypothetical protein n=1 Tax=Metallosphaera sp. TaxID=2020860 RepID=UPI003160E07D